LDRKDRRIAVGGRWFDVTARQFDMLSVLFKARGRWVGGKTFGADARPDKWMKRMPPEVKGIIQTHKVEGYRIPALR
jgi:hypothetical protein